MYIFYIRIYMYMVFIWKQYDRLQSSMTLEKTQETLRDVFAVGKEGKVFWLKIFSCEFMGI